MSESKEQGGAPPEGPGDHVSLFAYQEGRRMQVLVFEGTS